MGAMSKINSINTYSLYTPIQDGLEDQYPESKVSVPENMYLIQGAQGSYLLYDGYKYTKFSALDCLIPISFEGTDIFLKIDPNDILENITGFESNLDPLDVHFELGGMSKDWNTLESLIGV